MHRNFFFQLSPSFPSQVWTLHFATWPLYHQSHRSHCLRIRWRATWHSLCPPQSQIHFPWRKTNSPRTTWPYPPRSCRCLVSRSIHLLQLYWRMTGNMWVTDLFSIFIYSLTSFTWWKKNMITVKRNIIWIYFLDGIYESKLESGASTIFLQWQYILKANFFISFCNLWCPFTFERTEHLHSLSSM